MAAIARYWMSVDPEDEPVDLAGQLRDSVIVADLESQARHERVIAREHAEEGRHADAIECLGRAAGHERDAADIAARWADRKGGR